jgi:hypothetical protein
MLVTIPGTVQATDGGVLGMLIGCDGSGTE